MGNRVAGALLAMAGAAAVLLLLAGADTVIAQSANPFETSKTFLETMTTSARSIVAALAGAAAVIVIFIGMLGYIQWGWVARIVVGLIAISGVGWMIDQIPV